jgi:hypothetical protein
LARSSDGSTGAAAGHFSNTASRWSSGVLVIGVQLEASLQLSIHSYATTRSALAAERDVCLRFDVLTNTKIPEYDSHLVRRVRGELGVALSR